MSKISLSEGVDKNRTINVRTDTPKVAAQKFAQNWAVDVIQKSINQHTTSMSGVRKMLIGD